MKIKFNKRDLTMVTSILRGSGRFPPDALQRFEVNTLAAIKRRSQKYNTHATPPGVKRTDGARIMLPGALTRYVGKLRAHYGMTREVWAQLNFKIRVALSNQFDLAVPTAWEQCMVEMKPDTPNGPICERCGGAALLCKCPDLP